MLIATPNITVDRTVRLAQSRPGSVLRPARAVVTAGGKEVNVGRMADAFGRRATLAGFRPEDDSAVLDRLFTAEPIDFVGGPVEALEEGRTGPEMVRFAVATATAPVEQELADGVDPRRVREITAQLTRPDGDRAADATTGAAT